MGIEEDERGNFGTGARPKALPCLSESPYLLWNYMKEMDREKEGDAEGGWGREHRLEREIRINCYFFIKFVRSQKWH